MKAGTTCSVCGKSMSKGYICEDCEKKILEEGKSKRYALTILTTLLLVFIAYFMWNYYKTSEAEFAKIKSGSDVFLAVVLNIAKSRFMILFGVVIIVTVFYYVSTRSARRS